MTCPGPSRDPDAPCGKPVMTCGLCSGHYHQRHKGKPLRPLTPQRPAGTPCAYGPCSKPIAARDLCIGHYRQLRAGKELQPLQPRRGGKTKGDAA